MNKKSTVAITVVGIVALVIAIIGATYAYFTAQVRYVGPPGGSDIIATAATLGEITFDAGPRIELINAFPGDSMSNVFKVSADPNATNGVAYEVRIRITENDFENVNNYHTDSPFVQGRDFTNLRIHGNLTSGDFVQGPVDSAFANIPVGIGDLRAGPGYIREGQTGDFLFASTIIYPGEVHEWNLVLTLNMLERRFCDNGGGPVGCPPAPWRIEQFNTNFDQGKSFRATIDIVPTGQYTALNRPPVAP